MFDLKHGAERHNCLVRRRRLGLLDLLATCLRGAINMCLRLTAIVAAMRLSVLPHIGDLLKYGIENVVSPAEFEPATYCL